MIDRSIFNPSSLMARAALVFPVEQNMVFDPKQFQRNCFKNACCRAQISYRGQTHQVSIICKCDLPPHDSTLRDRVCSMTVISSDFLPLNGQQAVLQRNKRSGSQEKLLDVPYFCARGGIQPLKGPYEPASPVEQFATSTGLSFELKSPNDVSMFFAQQLLQV